MPSRKQLAWLAGAIVLLAGFVLVHVYLEVPHRKAPFAKATDQSARIELSQGASGVTLIRSGKDWTVQSSTSAVYPADPDRVRTLLSGLPSVQLEDVIADRADRAADFDVDPAKGTRVQLLGASKNLLADGIFGKQAPDYSHIYFRFPDQNTVYLARGILRGELGGTTLEEWRSRDIVTAAEPDFRAIQVDKGGSHFTFEHSSDTWTLDGRKIDPAPVYGLSGTLAHLKADAFLTETEAAAQTFTAGKITFTTDAGSKTLLFAPTDPKTKRVAVRIDGDPQAFWIFDSKAQSLFPKKSSFTYK